jgi:glutamate-ammonia-ligase adenylyltransferase
VADAFFGQVGCDLTVALGAETREGSLYHVGTPAWHQADAALQARSLADYHEHYAGAADVLVRCTLTRARPVAGDAELGLRFIATIDPLVYGALDEETAAGALRRMEGPRAAGQIERVTQLWQVCHGAVHAPLRQRSTLAALEAMCRAGLIDEAVQRELHHAYVWLRSAEHRRQLGLHEDADPQLLALVGRVGELCRGLAGVAPSRAQSPEPRPDGIL